ncbi:MAG: NAD(P)-dependent oxidoreductase, partial [Thermodesulfobacteriota bacterium]
MKILANDGLVEEGIQYLHKEGFEVDTVKRDLDDLIGDIKDFDALLVRSATKVTREVIEAGTKNGGKLKIIGRGGVGTDNIDLVAARENGVIVKFAPNGNTNATAEHALGLMFAVARKVPFAHATIKSGVWHKKRFQGVELMGKTLGIIGCGRIGQALAAKAKALGMKVVGYDVYRKLDSDVDYLDTVDDVLKASDFVSLHTGGRETLIGPHELKIMKDTAYLI